jgi:aminomethyltransferase
VVDNVTGSDGYRELREGVALVNLTGRGHIALTGEDRARLLHAMSTNHIQELQPGGGCYAFLLSAQGRILADCHVLCMEDALILDTEPESAERVVAHLDQYIIADDCSVTDLTASRGVFGVEGPKAADLLREITGADLPPPHGWIAWQNGVLAAISSTGQPGYRIYVDTVEAQWAEDWLLGAGAVPATDDECRTVRIENAFPRHGEDFGDHQIPHETQILSAVHFGKGCYLGQEIVERVRSRGQVNRKLVQLAIDSGEPPPSGTKITLEGRDVGEVTSSAVSPGTGKVVALGYLRTEAIDRKVAVRVGMALARTTDRVPSR